MADVMTTCLPNQAATRQGPPDTCPTLDDITVQLEDYGFISCMLQTLGWVDESYTQLNETISMDSGSLDQDLAAQLSEESIKACVATEVDAMHESSEGQLVQGCMENYSEEELTILIKIVTGIAGLKCFKESFDEACRTFVDANCVQPFIQSRLMPGNIAT